MIAAESASKRRTIRNRAGISDSNSVAAAHVIAGRSRPLAMHVLERLAERVGADLSPFRLLRTAVDMRAFPLMHDQVVHVTCASLGASMRCSTPSDRRAQWIRIFDSRSRPLFQDQSLLGTEPLTLSSASYAISSDVAPHCRRSQLASSSDSAAVPQISAARVRPSDRSSASTDAMRSLALSTA